MYYIYYAHPVQNSVFDWFLNVEVIHESPAKYGQFVNCPYKDPAQPEYKSIKKKRKNQ